MHTAESHNETVPLEEVRKFTDHKSIVSIYRAAKRGDFPALVVGRRVIVPREPWERWKRCEDFFASRQTAGEIRAE